MEWPDSWLNILVAVHLYRSGKRWTPQVEIANALQARTAPANVYAILLRMRTKKFLILRPKSGRRSFEVRLSAAGKAQVREFLEEVG